MATTATTLATITATTAPLSVSTPHLKAGVNLFKHQSVGLKCAVEMESRRDDEENDIARGARGRQFMGWFAWPAGAGKSLTMIALARAAIESPDDGRTYVSQVPSKRRRVTNVAGMDVTFESDTAAVPCTVVVVSSTLLDQWEQYLTEFTVWEKCDTLTLDKKTKTLIETESDSFIVINNAAKAKMFAHALNADFVDWRKALNSRSKKPVEEADFHQVCAYARAHIAFALVSDTVYHHLVAASESWPSSLRFSRLAFDEFDSLTPLNAKAFHLLPAEFNWYISANVHTVQSGFAASSTGTGALSGKMTSTMDAFRERGMMDDYMRAVSVPILEQWASDMRLPDITDETRFGYVPHDLAAHCVATKTAFIPALKVANVRPDSVDWSPVDLGGRDRLAAMDSLLASGCMEDFMEVSGADYHVSANVFWDESESPSVPLEYLRAVLLTKDRKLSASKLVEYDSESRRADMLDDACQITCDKLTACKAVTCCHGCMKHFSLMGIMRNAVHNTRAAGGDSSADLWCWCPNCKTERMVVNRLPILLRGPNRYGGMRSISDAVVRSFKSIFGDEFTVDSVTESSKANNNDVAVTSERMVLVFYDDIDEAAMREAACRVFSVSSNPANQNLFWFAIDHVRNPAAAKLTGISKMLANVALAKTPVVLFLTTRAFSVGLNLQFATDVVLASRQTDPVNLARVSEVVNIVAAQKISKLAADLRHQLVGRAQRFGRTSALRLHTVTSCAGDVAPWSRARSPRVFRTWNSEDPLAAVASPAASERIAVAV